MPTAQEVIDQAQKLLLEGKVNEAHALLGDKLKNPDPPPPPTPAEPAIPPPPAWVSDVQFAEGLFSQFVPLLEQVVIHLGGTPVLRAALEPITAIHNSLKSAGKSA